MVILGTLQAKEKRGNGVVSGSLMCAFNVWYRIKSQNTQALTLARQKYRTFTRHNESRRVFVEGESAQLSEDFSRRIKKRVNDWGMPFYYISLSCRNKAHVSGFVSS